MRLDRKDGFTSLISGQDSLIDSEMLGNWPQTPLEERVRTILTSEILIKANPKLIAEKIISTGVYNFPLTYKEFSVKKFRLFKTLATLNKKSVTRNDLDATDSVKLLSILARTMGILSKDEIGFTKGGIAGNLLGYLNPEDFENYYSIGLNCHTEMRSRVVPLEEAIRLSSAYKNIGLNVAISFGTFDILNEGQQSTLALAKDALGSNTVVMVGVADKRISEIVKGKSPIKELPRRMENILFTKGTNIIFPIVPPDSVITKEELVDFFYKLHLEFKAHFRIVGNPKNTGIPEFLTYQNQCQHSTTLLIYNENFVDVSSTQDRKILETAQSA